MKKRTPSHFPLISGFARGYLHQDVVPEYGSPKGAATAYIADLDEPSKSALAKEVAQLRKSMKGNSTAKLNAEVHQMGSQWTFESVESLEEVLRILERGR